MKKLMIGMLLSFVFTVGYSQNITVRSQEVQDDNVDFEKYKTFYWASQVDNKVDEDHFFLNDVLLKAQLRDAIKDEMLGLGYQINSNEPDLILNFRVFDKGVQIQNNESYGTNYWGETTMRDVSDNVTYDLEPGTVLVSIADRKNGRVLWHGFASGLIENDTFIKDEGKIKEAVNLIFDEYGKRAKEYSKK
jgi:hypothetical protein